MEQILIIDDDERLAKPLGDFFSLHGLALSSATAPSAGLTLLDQKTFDLVVLDVNLPEMDGFALCRKVREQSNIPVIMLSARGEVSDRLTGLELGADDYLPKPFEPMELVMRIRNILKRSEHSQPRNHLVNFENLTIDKSIKAVTVNGKEVNLTTNEYQVLMILASSPGKNFTRDDILNFLKGAAVDIYTRSVDIQVSRLRQKLKPTDYIKTVWGAGYQFIAPAAQQESKD